MSGACFYRIAECERERTAHITSQPACEAGTAETLPFPPFIPQEAFHLLPFTPFPFKPQIHDAKASGRITSQNRLCFRANPSSTTIHRGPVWARAAAKRVRQTPTPQD